MTLTLDGFVELAGPRLVRVEIDGQIYHLRPLSGAGREAYLRLVQEKPDHFIAGVLLFGLCNERGELLGDPFNAEHRAKVANVDGQLLQLLADEFLTASGLTDRASKEAEKKSDPSPSASSGTD